MQLTFLNKILVLLLGLDYSADLNRIDPVYFDGFTIHLVSELPLT